MIKSSANHLFMAQIVYIKLNSGQNSSDSIQLFEENICNQNTKQSRFQRILELGVSGFQTSTVMSLDS